MARLVGLGAMRVLQNGVVKPLRYVKQSPRKINTSSKPPQATHTAAPTTPEDFAADKTKNWISWGFSEKDQWVDRFFTHLTFFTTISLCIVAGGTVIAYAPDPKLKEWAQREAYLQLRYREDHGLPPIDRNYIDPAKIQLPSDEELGDTEIII